MATAQESKVEFPRYPKSLKTIAAKYNDPWIGEMSAYKDYGIDDLRFVQACEKEHLVEDPVYSDLWIVTDTGAVFPQHQICLALEDIKYIPSNPKAAVNVSAMILALVYDGCAPVLEDFKAHDNIPKEFFDMITPPKASSDENSYDVSLYVSHPTPPYAFGTVPLRWDLRLNTVNIRGYIYTVKEGPIIKTIENIAVDISHLENIIITHLVSQNMLGDMKEYLQKNELYGLINPPDESLVDANQRSLETAWEKGFAKHRGDILPVYRRLLVKDSDFKLDADTIIETAGYHANIRKVEYYDRKIRSILYRIRDDCIKE